MEVTATAIPASLSSPPISYAIGQVVVAAGPLSKTVSAANWIFLKPRKMAIGTKIDGIMIRRNPAIKRSSFLYLLKELNEIIVPIHINPKGVPQFPITLKGYKILSGIFKEHEEATVPRIPALNILLHSSFFIYKESKSIFNLLKYLIFMYFYLI